MSIIHNGEDTLQSASIARSQGLLERFLEVPQAWPVGNTTAAVQPDKKNNIFPTMYHLRVRLRFQKRAIASFWNNLTSNGT